MEFKSNVYHAVIFPSIKNNSRNIRAELNQPMTIKGLESPDVNIGLFLFISNFGKQKYTVIKTCLFLHVNLVLTNVCFMLEVDV